MTTDNQFRPDSIVNDLKPHIKYIYEVKCHINITKWMKTDSPIVWCIVTSHESF